MSDFTLYHGDCLAIMAGMSAFSYFDVASKRIERTSPSLLLPQKHDATHSNGALWVGEVGDFA